MPARMISTLPVAANRTAVCITCSSVSALHGPEIISGRFFSNASTAVVCSIACCIVGLLVYWFIGFWFIGLLVYWFLVYWFLVFGLLVFVPIN
jgi:hypothetical protein